jgi:hypothetical protein
MGNRVQILSQLHDAVYVQAPIPVNDNEEKKMSYTRKAQFVQDAMKLKEMGAGEKAVELLHSLYGDDTMPYAQEFGSELAKASGSAADQEKMASAGLDRAIAARMGGGGGTGAGNNPAGGTGGSGIVIISYPGSQKGSGGTVTSSGGQTIHTFTSSGTYTG